MAFAMFGSTLSLPGARTSSGVSTGRPSGSAIPKYKCSSKGVKPDLSHESGFPGGRTLLGFFLEIRRGNPQQSRLIGEGVVAMPLPFVFVTEARKRGLSP